ncbi:hypothetical protein BG015_010791 [Linnemannia schmuckeri]|uniref:Uncharacterized protein n=1 Tax=Linnemannia schmuckeri TaxID=64567 RepID=A0A9P5RX18_9FUNG|nr:hypothetical protein BG015_010791 [Linnemannia schmuckeri]
MTPDLREASQRRLQALLDNSSDCEVRGTISIIYEQLTHLTWVPGYRDNNTSPKSKHWKLVIQLGFDKFVLEFLENNQESHEGLVLVSPYTPSMKKYNTYLLGNIVINMLTFYRDISFMLTNCTAYSITNCNCQHFVQGFLFLYAKCFETRTELLTEILDMIPHKVTKRAVLASMCSNGSQVHSSSP